VDEKSALVAIHKKQKDIRLTSTILFSIIVAVSSVLFIVYPKALPGVVMQIIMLFAMSSIFGLLFLDRVSYTINKKLYKKDILHDYLFKHSKPDDMHKEVELVQELVVTRRQAAKEMKRGR